MMNIYQTVDVKRDDLYLTNLLSDLRTKKVYGVRFNMSRITDDNLLGVTKHIIALIEREKYDFNFLFDLPFPKRKSRVLQSSIRDQVIQKGHKYTITYDKSKYSNLINCILVDKIDYVNIWTDNVLYYGDGENAFLVTQTDETESVLNVIALNDGKIAKTKAINWGFSETPSSLQKKIHEVILECHASIGFAYSFVENSHDLFKYNIPKKDILTVAKIETLPGVQSIDDIIALSQGIMVARGDLALNISLECFYSTVKKIVSKGIAAKKRVFYATDILNSLDYTCFPCRADIMDIGLMLEMGCTDVVLPFRSDVLRTIDLINRIL